ncbi:hypothetical protein AL073_13865 [Loktanella sp. 1ANDIMAR09]|nr:hypothetical protein AL073_13865 [Loktanella sp. 1ANDIMAR09]
MSDELNELKRVGPAEWAKIVLQWEEQTNSYSENFVDHAPASMPVLEELATSAPLRDAGVYSYADKDEVLAILQANVALLPGYSGRVLRIRHIVLSPKYEFDDKIELDDYGSALVGVFAGTLVLSVKDMIAPHIKFHLRSPAERMFGEEFTKVLQNSGVFKECAMKGSRIYLSKT